MHDFLRLLPRCYRPAGVVLTLPGRRSHLGLTSSHYQSGETDKHGKIRRCGDELARTELYEAAHSLLTRSCKWSSLGARGMQVASRTSSPAFGRFLRQIAIGRPGSRHGLLPDLPAEMVTADPAERSGRAWSPRIEW